LFLRWSFSRVSFEAIDQREETSLRVINWVFPPCSFEKLAAVLPEGLEGLDRRRIIYSLKEIAQALSFRSAMFSISRIVNIYVEFGSEKFAEGRIGEF